MVDGLGFLTHKLLWVMRVVFVLTVVGMARADGSEPPLLLRFPTVSKTQIVFNLPFAGDLWIVRS